MAFNSMNFLLFMLLVVLIYFALPLKIRYIWLLLASYFLYVLESQIYRIIAVCNGGQLSVWITLRMGTKEMYH